MLVQNLFQVFLIDVRIPGTLGIHHDDRPIRASVEAASRIDASTPRTGDAELLRAPLQVVA
jgi:hypothetical protein